MELWLAIKMLGGNIKKLIFPLFGIIAGTMSLIITLSISTGGKEIISSSLLALGENRIMIGGDNLTQEDLSLIENIPVVDYAFFPESRIMIDDNIYIGYPKSVIKNLRLKSLKDREVILDKNQFMGYTIGNKINLNLGNYSRDFLIKDKFQEKNPYELMKKGNRIIMLSSTYENLFKKSTYTRMIISFKDGEEANDYIPYILKTLKINKSPYSNFVLLETPEVYKKVMEIKQMVNLSLGSISLVSLILGGLGIFNLIASNIKSRTSQIAILRAMGMSEARLIITFLLEASLISIIGSIIGSVIGSILSIMVGRIINIPPVFEIEKIILAMIISLIFGIGMGIYPTREIGKKSLVVSLKETY